jgi:VanZ family protein
MDPTPTPATRPTGRFLSAWIPVIAWAGLIFVLSAQPNLVFLPDAGLDLVVRKAGHMAVFGVLFLLLFRALAETTDVRRRYALAFLATVLYATTDELHQGFVAGRHVSVVDVAIDAAGALIAVALLWLVRLRHA